MIIKAKSLKVEGGQAPYNYSVSSTCTDVTLINGTGVSTDGVIDFTIQYSNQAAIPNCQILVNITDTLGCAFTYEVANEDICNNLVITNISQNSYLNFNTIASGGSGSYSYAWSFDTNTYELDDSSPSNNTLQLKFKSPVVLPKPKTINLTVVATDSNGCTTSRTNILQLCEISPADGVPEVTLNPNSSQEVCFNTYLVGCLGLEVNWGSFQLTNPLPAGVTMSVGSLDSCRIFTSDGTIVDGSVTVTWTVEDEDGHVSDEGTFIVNTVANSGGFIDPPTAVDDVECTTCGNTVDINVLANDFDFDSSTVNITLSPTNGSAVVLPSGEIRYTANPTFSGNDTLEYTVNNNQGTSNVAIVVISVVCAGSGTTTTVCN